MARKKVKRDELSTPTTKERVEKKVEVKKIISYVSNTTKNKWDKIKGVEGDIVRFKTNDTKRQWFLKDKNHKLLYVGVDNDILYYYYNIKR
tara:strand:+ start:669 stop:941 length:273 start_codon:yes stop_codon:yes gene_type:complete